MVRALRLLQHIERRGVVALPLEPLRETLDCLTFGGRGVLDAERIARVFPHGARDPLSLAFGAENLHRSPKRDGVRNAMSGSMRFSSIASATSWAVSGASNTPLR